ncbi:prolyl oligopeptidase family serine peptidase [Psychrobacter sp. I-STPA6b]|uniref:prolyl oligopeptidase family serine peptidase n=1 Tax=Psychrobacter sp. I-STPA6b TaxID=2585718 RepID=UPI001D0C2E35|nr:prolyl oligopeptidase family serine peptidase [Psychrobacter sp. I-STPA6b]
MFNASIRLNFAQKKLTTALVSAGLSISFLSMVACSPISQISAITPATPPQEKTTAILPPQAEKRPHSTTLHDDKRIDNYHWLTQADNKEQASLLITQENDYLTQLLSQQNPLKENTTWQTIADIEQESQNRMDSHRQPRYWHQQGYYFKEQFAQNSRYPDFYYKADRQPTSDNSKDNTKDNTDSLDATPANQWQLIWSSQQRMQTLGVRQYQVNAPTLSPLPQNTSTNTQYQPYIAIAEDTTGMESYDIIIKNSQTGQIADTITQTNGDYIWLNAQQILYIRQQHHGQSFKVLLHTIGDEQDNDPLIFESKNRGFYVWLSESSSGDYIFITANSQTSSQVWYLAKSQFANTQQADLLPKPVLFKALAPNQEYYLDHYQGHFYIRSNHALNQSDSQNNTQNNPNSHDQFGFYRTDEAHKDTSWQPLFIPKQDELFESFMFQDNWVIYKTRKQGASHLVYADLRQAKPTLRYLDFPDKAYMLWLEHSGFDDRGFDDGDFNESAFLLNKDILRVGYTSMTTPKTVLSYDLKTGKRLHTAINKTNRPADSNSNSNHSNYRSERLEITGKDGTKIPVTLVYKTSLFQANKNPLLVYGYGAYGHSLDPMYGSSYTSLLDRGFVYAIAHVRGGGELGENWHTQGKFLNKQNSFDDFIAVTKALQNLGYGDKHKTFAMGESAGGLLVANACISEPSLYRSCILQVPFVDVLSSVTQSSPAKSELEEWGNPKNKPDYDNIKSYNPYDIISQKSYPSFLVIANVNDIRTSHLDALKFVQKLREYNQSNNPILLKTHLQGGHSGAFGRASRIKNNALSYGFMLNQLDNTDSRYNHHNSQTSTHNP